MGSTYLYNKPLDRIITSNHSNIFTHKQIDRRDIIQNTETSHHSKIKKHVVELIHSDHIT